MEAKRKDGCDDFKMTCLAYGVLYSTEGGACCPSGCAWEWDNLTCWQAASMGEIVVVNCPELFEFMSPEEGESFFFW